MKRLIYLIIFILTLYSCDNKSIDPLSTENKNLPINEKIKLAISTSYLDSIGLNNECIDFIYSYYSSNNYQPLWIDDSTLSKTGNLLIESLKEPLKFGIPSIRFQNFNWEKANFLQKELMITSYLALLSEDLTKGLFLKDTLLLRAKTFPSLDYFDSLMKFNNKNIKTIEKQIINWGSKDTSYQKLANTLFNFCKTTKIDTLTFNVPSQKKDSINSFLRAKEALISKGLLSSENNNDSIQTITALKKFQIQNGLDSDGRIGTYTCKALNESTYHKILRTIITLDKWRGAKPYQSNYIRINIPEYMLFLSLDSAKQNQRIIIGKPDTKTPELESIINRFVLFPYWTVPQSIKNKEMLPEAQKNSAYFKRNNLKIFKNDIEIDPSSIDWNRYKNTFPFKVRQEFGPKNSLGIIKFEFNNPFGVYVHDTPNKTLFNKDIRAFSHGCMRCQNPIQLAKTILKYDYKNKNHNKIDSLKIDSLITVGLNHTIHLLNPIKIFVEYKSVIVKNEQLIFLIDIYDKDEKFLRLLKS